MLQEPCIFTAEVENSDSYEFRLLRETIRARRTDRHVRAYIRARLRLLSIRVSLAVNLERDCDGHAFEQQPDFEGTGVRQRVQTLSLIHI